MKLIDTRCPRCGHVTIDHFQRTSEEELPLCRACISEAPPTRVERVFLPTNRGTVIPDDIPGGIYIKHGLCNPDGTPRRYDSKSELRREGERRGLSNHVEHRPDSRGSDKSKHTSRWV